MFRKSLWCVLLVVPLAFGLNGCGKKTKKTGEPEKTKTEKSVTEKSKTPAKSVADNKTGKGTPTGKKKETGKGTPSGNGVATGTGKVVRPTVLKPIDTSYISSDFIAAAVIHPAQAYNSRFAKAVLAEVEKSLGKEQVDQAINQMVKQAGFDPRTIEQVIVMIDNQTVGKLIQQKMMGSPGGPPGEKGFPKEQFKKKKDGPAFPKGEKKEKTSRRLGGKESTQDVALLAQPGGPDAGPPIPSVIIRFNKAPDQQAVLRLIPRVMDDFVPHGGKPEELPFPKEKIGEKKEKEPQDKKEEKQPPRSKEPPQKKGPVTKQIGGKTAHMFGPLAVCFVDDKTVLASTEGLLAKMLAAKDVKSPLVNRLSKLGSENDLVLALDVTPLIPLLGFIPAEGLPPDQQQALGYAKKIKTIALVGGLSGEMLLSGIIEMADSDSATGLAKLVRDKALPEFNKFYANFKNSPDYQSAPPQAQIVADRILESFGVKADGNDVIIGVARPKELDELPKLIGPMLKQLNEGAKGANRLNNLKQIGLAFFNFESFHARLPTYDSNGAPGAKTGLSWRVHLLPMLEQRGLYQQFKLDEPWDSANNKKLISAMPSVFADPDRPDLNKAGKTSVHVFTGKGTPLDPRADGKNKGISLTELADTSTTILVVAAGPDKAEIWTKPGGIPFDGSKVPRDLLGNIGDGFPACFADGSVRNLDARHTPEAFADLVRYKPVSVKK